MESSSEANKVHASAAAYEELQKEGNKLSIQSRGVIEVKGKGESWGMRVGVWTMAGFIISTPPCPGMMETYWVSDRVITTRIAGLTEEELEAETERRRSGRSATPRPSVIQAVKKNSLFVTDKSEPVDAKATDSQQQLPPLGYEIGGDSIFALQTTVVVEDGSVKIHFAEEPQQTSVAMV
jgi:hypothetical protein